MRQQLKEALQTISAFTALLIGGSEANLATAAAPKPSLTYKTKALIDMLGSDVFAEREFASLSLGELVKLDATAPIVIPHIKAATKSEDLEVKKRAERLVHIYYNLLPTDFPVFPWIDSLPSGDSRISKYLKMAQDEWPHLGSGPDFPTHRRATQLMVRDMIDDGKPRAEIIKLLDKMAEGDREQVRTKAPNHRLANGLLEK